MTPMIPPTTRLLLSTTILPSTMTIQAWGEKSKWKMAPQLIISAVTSKTQDDLPIEEITFPSDMPTEEPTSALASEQNDYSLSGYPS